MRFLMIIVVALAVAVLSGAVFSGFSANMADIRSQDGSPSRQGAFVDVRLEHDSEPAKTLRLDARYLAGNFRSNANAQEGGGVEQVILTFAYPGLGFFEDNRTSDGDCDERERCRYSAAVQVAAPGATERFFNSTVGRDMRRQAVPPTGSPDDDEIAAPGLERVFVSDWRVSFYAPPGRYFESAILINCNRASRINVARCRLFFETRESLSVVIGGVLQDDLSQWRELVTDISELIDNAVR